MHCFEFTTVAQTLYLPRRMKPTQRVEDRCSSQCPGTHREALEQNSRAVEKQNEKIKANTRKKTLLI